MDDNLRNAILLVVLPSILLASIGAIGVWFRRGLDALVIQVLGRRPTTDEIDALERYATIAAQAAEQLGMTGQVADKLEYALGVTTKFLVGRGIKIDADQIRAAVEAAVLINFNFGRIDQPVPVET